MSDQWKEYVDDSRTICKYGVKCYQKNSDHHKKYKHPPLNVKRKYTGNHNHGTAAKIQAIEENTKRNEDTSNTECETPTKLSLHTASENENSFIINIPDDVEYIQFDNNDLSILKNLFLVKMPQDFYSFYECISNNTDDVDKVLSSVNLQLIGPYELLLGKMPILENKELYLIHWRYYYDPPEFQSLFKSQGNSEYHFGYYRDSPNEDPVLIASNNSSKGCTITPVAFNMFGAVYFYLQNEKKKSPFSAMNCQKLMDKVKKWADENNYTLDYFDMKQRIPNILTKTLHGVGIVGPYDKKTKLGYRPLVESYTNLKKMFHNFSTSTSKKEKDDILSNLQPVITYATIAVDECDFITGLECGINLFCSGIKELEASAQSSMCSAYSLLKRNEFAQIIKAHLKYRRKGPNMSVLANSNST